MNRQEAKEYIQEWLKDEYALNGEDRVVLNMAIEALQDDWIPVSEGPPEDAEEVLVTVHFLGLDMKSPAEWVDFIEPATYVETASHIDGKWYSDSDEYKIASDRHIVTAWKPLPEPYKESAERIAEEKGSTENGTDAD